MNAAKIRIASGLIGGIAILTLTACNSSQAAAPSTPPVPTISTSTSANPPVKADAAPVADNGTTAPAPEGTTAPAAKADSVIGPRSFGEVAMSMTFADLKAAGLIRDATPPDPRACSEYPIFVNGKLVSYVSLSAGRGVESIRAGNAHTPEGVKIGWTVAKVKKVYPGLNLNNVNDYRRDLVPVPGNSTAVYRIGFHNGVVQSVTLQLADQACYE